MMEDPNHEQQCSEPGCEEPAGVRLHIPWEEDRVVCPAHGRSLAQQRGVVAVPLDGSSTDWP